MLRNTFRTGTLALLLSGLALGTTKAQVKQEGTAKASVKAAIDALWDKAILASKKGDAETMATIYTPDVMLIDPTMPTVVGRDNVVKLLRDMFATTKFVDETHQQTALEVSADLAVENGTYTQTTQERGKTPQSVSGRYTLVFRNVNGQWFVIRDITTPNPTK
ncbi:MAG TPA: SgcJ/EcaC family oxidoreductase [Gemmatimonadaceae bacterium]|jgi:uncharacterized protein (TIGR02246 family)|nr:SgcJ/EcaC family oxidoreductase [Gemmatimonadaceae bacterium]